MSEEELTLENIRGIGPKTAQKLREKGIATSPEQLAVRSPLELASELGITKKAAKDIIADAKNKALDKAIKLFTFKDIKKYRDETIKKIPTGAIALDSLLTGGVSTTALTGFSGEFASGKTQICIQLAINCLKHLKRKVAWVETESGTFVPERVQQVAKANGYTINMDEDFVVVPSRYIGTQYNQFLALELIERKIKAGMDIGLIIIDSFSAKFRGVEYGGRETLPDRSRDQGRHLGFMDQLASKYNLAVVFTIQVIDTPDAGMQLHNIMKYGNRKAPIGGNILKHSGTYLISLSKVKGDEWEACVYDAPELPMEKERFRITAAGIRDIQARRKKM